MGKLVLFTMNGVKVVNSGLKLGNTCMDNMEIKRDKLLNKMEKLEILKVASAFDRSAKRSLTCPPKRNSKYRSVITQI